jgi:FAD/FMN-containing dehydrogenase
MPHKLDLGDLDASFSGRLLTDPSDLAPFLTDWRRKWTGRAQAVAQPDTTDDVAAIVRWCAARGVPMVPQGGNTSLSGGSVPDQSGAALVLSLVRLNRIRSVDPQNNTLVAEAGCLLSEVQRCAADAGRLFGLSLAAEGSCTIGGNLATNAGGTATLLYGNAREQCLGIEVVTPAGEVWNGLKALRKNNTGYDLRDIYIGAEGTLGVITAAVLRLHPKPGGRALGFVALESLPQANALLDISRNRVSNRLSAFELVSETCLGSVLRHHPAQRHPLARRYPWYALIEVSDVEGFEQASLALNRLLQDASERDIVCDGVIADSLGQVSALWALRENISEAQGREGPTIKHDIALPISSIPGFVESTMATIAQRWPSIRLFIFGHLGDGNLHYNASPAPGMDHTAFLMLEPELNQFVHDAVYAANGSISAEHGLGVLRREEAARYATPIELELQRAIKRALDPHNIMNPGKVIFPGFAGGSLS